MTDGDDPFRDPMATVADVMLLMEPLALRIGQRYPRREGIEREDLIAEAWLALHDLAPRYLVQAAAVYDAAAWFAVRIRERLRAYVRRTLFAFLEGVPNAWRRRAIRVYVATERLKARGILRPSYEQIAGEALIDVEVVLMVATFPRVVRRQAAVEWAEDHGQSRPTDEPDLTPLFPVTSFVPASDCPHYTRIGDEAIPGGPLPKDTSLCCMVCSKSGKDHVPSLRRSKATDPKPEPRPEKAATTTTSRAAAKQTRRERRRLLWGPNAGNASESVAS